MPRIIRRDLSDPDTLRQLTESGAVWRTPSLWQDAIDAINSGAIDRAKCKNIPPEAMAALKEAK